MKMDYAADSSSPGVDDVPPSKGTSDVAESQSTTAADVSKDKDESDAAPPPPPLPQSQDEQASSSTTEAKKQHKVIEVPKFRFVAIAKKSAGYSSAAAGSYIEGKSAEELAAQYQEPDIVASDASTKKEPVVVGKLNIAARQSEMELEFGLGSGFDKKVGGVEREEEEDEPTIQEEMEEPVEQPEEKDLEAALPAGTENKVVNEEVSNDEMHLPGVLYSVDSGEVVEINVAANKEVTSKESTAERRTCSTKNLILFAIMVILLVAAVVLGVAVSKKPSGDDTSSLQGENQNHVGVGNVANVTSTIGPSASLASWNTPTRSPNPPTAYFDEPSQAPVPTATQRCIGFFPEDTCMVEAEVKQQIFAPRSGDNLVNVNFGHALAFINDNIIAAATDGSAPGAGVHIFYKSDGMNAYDHFQTLYGDQQNLVNNKFGYSLATSKNTNTLIVGAPSRNASDVKVDCVQQWCELCSWSATDSTPCGERLDIIVQSSTGDEDQIKQQIMTTGQCIADEICNEVVTAGAVYIYEPTGSAWERVSILTSDDPSFGSVVAMDEGVIAIGSPYQDKVTIYEKTGNSWTLLETKVSPAKGVKFGASLSLSGGALVIGAPLDGVGGVAYVYARSARSFVPLGQPLVPRDISPGDNFGEKVSVSGCTVAVSSSNDITASTTGTGSIRIFNYDYNLDYFSADQIVEPTEDVTGVFPECLVMKGNDLLVGSSSGRSSGILTHFTRRNNVWTYKSVISNPHQDGGSAAGVFGCGLSISGSKALVGAKGTEQGPPGSFYVAALCPDDELI